MMPETRVAGDMELRETAMTTTAVVGWRCPTCARCYAPWVLRCAVCGPCEHEWDGWNSSVGPYCRKCNHRLGMRGDQSERELSTR